MAPPPLQKWKVLSTQYLTNDVFEIKLERPEGMTFRAGQYLSIVIPGAGPGGRNLRRAYSIASPPEWNEIELCIKYVEGGPGTTYLRSLKAGDEMEAQGPFGTFCLEHDLSHPTLFIGTGTGIAPLRGMILSDEYKSKVPTGFLLGVRHESDIIYPELFNGRRPEEFKDHEHFNIAISRPKNDDWSGFKGRVTDYLRSMKNWDFEKAHYYLCGSGEMIKEVKEILTTTKNVNKDQIHVEKYF